MSPRAGGVAITGLGMVSSLGPGTEAHWQRIVDRATGIRQIREEPLSATLRYAGRVEGYTLPPGIPGSLLKQEKFMSPTSRLGLGAVTEAVVQSGLDLLQIPPERKALYIGTGDSSKVGLRDYYPALAEAGVREGDGIDAERINRATLHKVNPFVLLEWLTNNLVAFVAMLYQAQGPNTTLSSHSPCGAQAVELAARSILRGQADVAIVAGTCTWIGPISLFEMDTVGLLSQCHDGARSFRPFDRRRDGFITGEGAAALVLEAPDLARRRGASVLGTLRGFGSFTQVNPTGGLGIPAEATEKAVAASLREAGIAPAGLAFVSPHGNGTRKGDHAELLALARVLDSAAGSVPVCGLKPYTGHMGAASDIAEIALGLVALRHGLLPATLNFGATDKDFSSLQVIGEHRPTVGKHFLSMSQGLGGQSFAAAVSAE